MRKKMQIMRESYTRIEPEAGGAADRRRIYAPCIEAAAYLTDAMGECRRVESRQRRAKPSMPESHKEMRQIFGHKKSVLHNFFTRENS